MRRAAAGVVGDIELVLRYPFCFNWAFAAEGIHGKEGFAKSYIGICHLSI